MVFSYFIMAISICCCINYIEKWHVNCNNALHACLTLFIRRDSVICAWKYQNFSKMHFAVHAICLRLVENEWCLQKLRKYDDSCTNLFTWQQKCLLKIHTCMSLYLFPVVLLAFFVLHIMYITDNRRKSGPRSHTPKSLVNISYQSTNYTQYQCNLYEQCNV